MRHILSTALVALIVGSLAGITVSALAQEPAPTAPDDGVVTAGLNADSVDGKHAVSATNKKTQRRNKLVAADSKGYLPSNIVKPKWGLISEKPAAFADGQIGWGEVQGIPGPFADGVDSEGVTGLTIFRKFNDDFVPVAAGVNESASVVCPAGSYVVGGGYASSSFLAPDLRYSAATNATSWTVSVRNDSGAAVGVKAFAICLAVQPGTAVTTAARNPQPARLSGK